MPETYAIHVDTDLCRHCGACVRECPISRFHGYTQIDAVHREECLLCGHCLAVCPHGAISHDNMTVSRLDPAAISSAQLLQAMSQRRSVRHFAPTPVTVDDWEAILTAVRYSPTGLNGRSVQATIITDPKILDEISAQTARLAGQLVRLVRNPVGRLALMVAAGAANVTRLRAAEAELQAITARRDAGDDPILHHAPGALILHADRKSPTGHDDCVLAAMAAMLAAPSIGLGTCMIGFALIALQRIPALRTCIELPATHDVAAILAVGYPATEYHCVPLRPEIPVRWIKR
ncbi:MAG TPA: nitroreductase family protein [Armatimonadota bacterium]|nr:nitroreductase family protein [Armatimonadota bacterium]